MINIIDLKALPKMGKIVTYKIQFKIIDIEILFSEEGHKIDNRNTVICLGQ